MKQIGQILKAEEAARLQGVWGYNEFRPIGQLTWSELELIGCSMFTDARGAMNEIQKRIGKGEIHKDIIRRSIDELKSKL